MAINTVPTSGLNALRYSFDADATHSDLLEDAAALLNTAASAAEAMTDAATGKAAPREVSEPWFAMLYAMRGARARLDHAIQRQPAGAAPSEPADDDEATSESDDESIGPDARRLVLEAAWEVGSIAAVLQQ